MTKIQNTKLYDLEERTFQFAKNTALYIKQLPRNISNIEYGEQVVGSSGSVGPIIPALLNSLRTICITLTYCKA
jgi:hypothetical protein